ncbi:MAG: pyridoxamine 5'-phosphate oxidase family protein [Chloroflexota bacterium]
MRRKDDILHPGEIEAQRRFGVEHAWSDAALSRMIKTALDPTFTAFIDTQQFFFIATADAEGNCDCSFRGSEKDADGTYLKALKVLDEKRLVFPDFKGNSLYNSLGNIVVNPHIGMLFIDFQRQQRVRLNGRAKIIEDQRRYSDIWPMALRYVLVTVEQVYANCPDRIPNLVRS